MIIVRQSRKTTVGICACAVSIALTSCGGGSSRNDDVDVFANDDNSTELPTTPVETPDVDITDTGTPDTGSSVPRENPVILPTDDIFTGGYVGNSGPLRDTITIPDTTAGYLIGIVSANVNLDLGVSDVVADGAFGSFDSARRFSEFVSTFNRPLDSCHLTNLIPFTGFGERFFVPPILGFAEISAGDVLPLTAPTGTTVAELLDGGILGYDTDRAFTGSIQTRDPFALSINIPGAEFPSFDTAEFPQTTEITGFRAQNSTQSLDERNFNPAETPILVWDASDNPDNFISMSFTADIPASVPGETNDDLSVAVECSLADDGEFQFPQQVIDLYPRTPFNAELRTLYRVAVNEVKQSDASLLLVSYSF